MRFLGVVTMFVVAGSALCRNVQLPADVANRVHLLHKLIYAGQKKEFERLLPELKDYVNKGDSDGHTPLHWTVYENDIDSAEQLLLHAADPNINDRYGRTALHEAARVGSNEMLTLMIDNGGDPKQGDQQKNWNSLFWAAFSGKKESLQTLMQHVDPYRGSRNEMDIYSVVLIPADPANTASEDPDKLNKVKMLLDAGVEPDIGQALMIVPLEEMSEMAELFDSYADKVKFNTININTVSRTNNATLLMKAMGAGSVAAVEFLLKQGAKVNTVNESSQNALTSPYNMREHFEIAKILIKHGIDVRNVGGVPAFYSAIIGDDVELAQLLLEHVTGGKNGKNPVPDAWFVFPPVPPRGEAAAALDLVKSEEMYELLLEYGLNQLSQTMLEGIQQRGYAQRGGQQQRSQSGVKGAPKFLRNFNAEAAEGKFKPVIGRENEIRQVITALARKEKNNPLLVGEAGVGKTAIVEGLAQRIVAGDVPEAMRDKTIFALDVGALIAGTVLHGAIEERVKELEHFVTELNKDKTILFIDEVHQLISQPSLRGVVDILKPLLARGDLHCVGATTQDEYQKHIMKDSALERRFFPVSVAEPSIEDTLAIVNGLKNVFEQHHDIDISDGAAQGAVKLANQYITNRFNPDKAIDLIDMAAARLVISGSNEQTLQFKHVAEVVSEMTDVPVERMLLSKQKLAQNLLPALRKHIFGQDQALKKIAGKLTPFLVGTSDPNKPASMLLLGSTGVGKTETAKVLAEYLFGSKDNLISINLSEYKDSHSLSSLIGAPASYVGYDESGILTESVRKKPYSVVLFDELGEAHPDVINAVLLKILDEGELADRKGRIINFKNTIIIITANTAAGKANGPIGFTTETEASHNPADLSEVQIPDKIQGRLGAVLAYGGLGPEVMNKLINTQLKRHNAQLEQNNVEILLTKTMRDHLLEKGYNPKLGARAMQNVFEEMIGIPVSDKIGAGEMKAGQRYSIGLRNGEITINARGKAKKKQ